MAGSAFFGQRYQTQHLLLRWVRHKPVAISQDQIQSQYSSPKCLTYGGNYASTTTNNEVKAQN